MGLVRPNTVFSVPGDRRVFSPELILDDADEVVKSRPHLFVPLEVGLPHEAEPVAPPPAKKAAAKKAAAKP